jgi:parvulin-like peptidyl-prolyl isomerase
VGDQIKLRMIFVKRGEPVATGTMTGEQLSSTSTNQSAPTNTEATAAATNTVTSATSTNVEASVATTNAEANATTTNSETSGTAAPPAVDLQRRLGDEILAKLDAGDSFESLARTYSEGKEAKEGGDWGWIGHDVLRKELNEIAFTLKKGQHSRIIETAEGYYILEVDDVKPAHTTALADVRDDIEKTLLQEQRTKMQEDWVKDLRAKAYIRIF